jgi:hypothetical protein
MKHKDPELCNFNATVKQKLTRSKSISCYCLKASKRNVLNGGTSLTAVAAILWDNFEKDCPLLHTDEPAFICSRKGGSHDKR